MFGKCFGTVHEVLIILEINIIIPEELAEKLNFASNKLTVLVK
jgi:hypothetical protein